MSPEVGASTRTRLTELVRYALEYAHAHGVVHRDVKPDNILDPELQPAVVQARNG